MPAMIVPAPAVQASAVGLLNTVRAINISDPHFGQGYTFQPNGCLPVVATGAQCNDDLETLDINDLPPAVSAIPILLATIAHCTTLVGTSRDDLQAAVANSLELVTGKKVASELWTGDISTANTYGNAYLAGGSPNFVDLTPSSDVSPGIYALGALQAYLADCAEGGRGMIHANRQTVNMWAAQQVVRRDGPFILDMFDNWIVADAGYDGSDPDGDVDASGDTAYAYATGLVDVRLGPVVPVPSLGVIADALDRGSNDWQFQTQRLASAMWDLCCHAGIRVGVCETCCTPGGAS